MLLAVDIGNSHTKFGVFSGETPISKLSIPTMRDITAAGLIDAVGEKIQRPVTDAIVSSVVPEVNGAVGSYISSYFSVTPFFVRNDLDFGLKINYQPLEDAGSDRLVNTFSAVETYGAPCIVCSFGTALTIDHVDKDRVLTGGLIAPGIKTLAAALKLTTSRLPEVAIEKPASVIQNTTIGGLQSGIVYGYLGLFEGLIRRIKIEADGHPRVIATGGFAELMSNNTDQIDIVDKDLMLNGLRLLAERRRGQMESENEES
ncbi:MAG: type III pantothenate kinase [Pyrinomonadaceae bacterium]